MRIAKPYSDAAIVVQSLAVALSVGAVVYHQAMTQLIAADLRVPLDKLWSLSVATQVGYGIGLVFALPMGDQWPARRLIPACVLGLGAVLLLQGLAPSLAAMLVLCLLAGILSVGGQLLIAQATKTAPSERRAAAVSVLLSALFGGLLLARLLGGWGGQYLGWRGVYLLVGVACVLLAAFLPATLLDAPITQRQSLGRVLRQQVVFWAELPELRRLSLVAACFFAASNGIWANLASQITAMHRSPGTTGALALTSALSIPAPWIVRRMQRGVSLPRMIALAALIIAVPALSLAVSGVTVLGLAAFLTLTDLSVRSVQALTQGRVLMIRPEAASRLNSLFMTVFFGGAALGSWLGGILIDDLGTVGMLLFPMICSILGVALTPRRGAPSPAATLGRLRM